MDTDMDTNRGSDPSKVWVSLITNLSYLPGLLLLDYSLKQTKSKFPLVALYTDDFPISGHHALDNRNISKRRINHLLPALEDDFYSNDPRFRDTWTKLAIFSLEEYSRVVLLDSDMLILKNMDELMELELDSPDFEGQGNAVFAASHACVCNPMKKPHYPKDWVPSACAFTAQHSSPELAQTQGASPLLSFGMPNSGLVVVNPSCSIYTSILEKLRDIEAVSKYIFPDQALLGDLFHGRWVTLPYVYNGLKPMRREEVHGKIWRDDRVKNVHYIFSPKPWEEDGHDILRGWEQNMERTNEQILSSWWHAANRERKSEELGQGHDDGL